MPFSTAARRVSRESSSEISPHSVPPSCQAPNPISEMLTPVPSNSLFLIQRLQVDTQLLPTSALQEEYPSSVDRPVRIASPLKRVRHDQRSDVPSPIFLPAVSCSASTSAAVKLAQGVIDQSIGLVMLVHQFSSGWVWFYPLTDADRCAASLINRRPGSHAHTG